MGLTFQYFNILSNYGFILDIWNQPESLILCYVMGSLYCIMFLWRVLDIFLIQTANTISYTGFKFLFNYFILSLVVWRLYTLSVPPLFRISLSRITSSCSNACHCFYHLVLPARKIGFYPALCRLEPALRLLLLLLSRFSRVRLCATPQTAAHQAPPSLRFSRQEHWSGLPFPSPMHESEKWKWSRSVVSDSQRPRGLQPTRLLHPENFPGKSTGVGCHCLLRCPQVSSYDNRKLTQCCSSSVKSHLESACFCSFFNAFW